MSSDQMEIPLLKTHFRNVWLASLISSLGDTFNNIGLLWLMLSLTGSGLAIGLTIAIRLLPPVLISPLAGMAIDRTSQRSIMLISDLLRACLCLGFLFVTSQERIWIAYILVAFMALATGFFQPARSASIPVLAPEKELVTANSLLHMGTRTVMIIGAGLGGFWVAGWGVQTAFVTNSISFLLSALLLAMIPDWHERKHAKNNSKEGRNGPTNEHSQGFLAPLWKIIKEKPILWAFLVVMIGWPIAGGAFNILLSLFPEKVFSAGAVGIGVLYAAYGAGTLFGSLFMLILKRSRVNRLTSSLRTLMWLAALGYIGNGIAELGVSRSVHLIGATGWMVIVGFCLSISIITFTSSQMIVIPKPLRGRYFAFSQGIGNAVLALSLVIGGLLLTIISARTMAAAAGLVHIGVGSIFALAILWIFELGASNQEEEQ